MKKTYSKPSSDIAIESQARIAHQSELLLSQNKITSQISKFPARHFCLLCGTGCKDDFSNFYKHRAVDYFFCRNCGHFQTVALLPEDYPYSLLGSGFESIYPNLETAQFNSRRDRIYTPKLDWALSCLQDASLFGDDDCHHSWMEIGCGAGYFLSALNERGIQNISGIDINPILVEMANKRLLTKPAKVEVDLFSALQKTNANIIAAFYVLEHIYDGRSFWEIMKGKPPGTIFIFAVPVFGLSTIFEGSGNNFPCRNLDGVIHTQLYTDLSIEWSLDNAGFDKIGEWVFGQDAQDILIHIAASLNNLRDDSLRKEYAEKLNKLVDQMQGAVDQLLLSDSRHGIAVNK